MKLFKTTFFPFLVLALTACGALDPVTLNVKADLYKYRYAYIMKTGSVTASTSVQTYYDGYVSGGVTHTVNPTDIMSGYLMKKGFTILPELDDAKLAETLVVSYGELGRRSVGFLFLDTASRVVVHLRDAKTNDLVASAEAEESGLTEADNIRYAINRALDAIFAAPRY